MRSWQLKDYEELDDICYQAYGDLPGALEAVIEANREKLVQIDENGKPFSIIDDLGVIGELSKPELIELPDLLRPTEIAKSERIFD